MNEENAEGQALSCKDDTHYSLRSLAIGKQCTLMSRITPLLHTSNYRHLSASATLRVLLLLDLAQRRLDAAIAASAAALGRRGLGLDVGRGGGSRGRRGRGQVGRMGSGGAPLALLLRLLLRRRGCAAAG